MATNRKFPQEWDQQNKKRSSDIHRAPLVIRAQIALWSMVQCETPANRIRMIEWSQRDLCYSSSVPSLQPEQPRKAPDGPGFMGKQCSVMTVIDTLVWQLLLKPLLAVCELCLLIGHPLVHLPLSWGSLLHTTGRGTWFHKPHQQQKHHAAGWFGCFILVRRRSMSGLILSSVR